MATGIGETLREAREERGLTLDDAALETRIRATHLAALEREEFERLGGEVYVRGFIRSYAKAIGLDPEPLLEDHHASAGPPVIEQPPTPLGREPLEGGPPRGLGFAAAGVAVVAIVALAVWGGGSSDEVDIHDDPLAGVDAEQEPADEDPDPDLGDEPDTEPADPTPTPTVPPGDRADDEPGTQDGGDRVQLEVVDREVWVRALVDDEERWQRVLSPGTTETFDDEGEIRLRLGDAGAVELTVAGRSVGAAGSDGQPVWVTIAADDEVTIQ